MWRIVWNWKLSTANMTFSISRTKQFGRQLSDKISKLIFVCENCYIVYRISVKFVLKGSVINKKTSISSNTNLAPTRHQGIVWTNDGLNYSHMLYSASTDCTHHGWLAVEQMSNACLCLALKKRPVCVKRRIMQLVVGNKTIFCVVALAHETARILVFAW